MQHLSARIARHVRKRKKMHWHIDFLRQEVESVVPVPIRSSRRDECEVARAYSKLLAPGPSEFGSSDCGCPTHLFFRERNPLHDRRFHEILQSFRMRPPTTGLTSPAAENVRRPRSTRRPRTKLPR
jgi:sugar fermentation stimulation protein A